MPAFEWCHRCLHPAPEWSSPEYREWHLVLTADGLYLGVVCVGCLADEELALVELAALAEAA